MYLRAKKRIKDGKEHRYWSIVESCRNLDGRVVQRQVLYLGEINDSQKAAWCRTIDVLQTDSSAKQMALFPTDRQAPELDCEVVQVKLNELRLHHPRQWGACWLALELWEQLELDRFWQPRLPVSRQGTKWLEVLKTQVCHQLIDPGSEWRLHRHWYEHSAMQDLLACCFPLYLVRSPSDLTGLFGRRISWDDGAIRETSGGGEVAFLMNDCCCSGEDVVARAPSVGKGWASAAHLSMPCPHAP